MRGSHDGPTTLIQVKEVVMMGSRGCKSGNEIDALVPKAKRNLRWRAGERPAMKRKFWKRERRNARHNAAEAAN